MTELEKIKQEEAPSGGMSREQFMQMAGSNYSEEDKKILCHNNIRKIRTAKERFLQENIDQLNEIEEITNEHLAPYIRGGFTSLICQSGGEYTIGEKEQKPQCSSHGTL